ncbi:hypothetical protein KY321_04740 [Candidatus Woesearchaeota archaeon]|nr:hypothetical protein [Candidatus Woesearchaeota archaeon]
MDDDHEGYDIMLWIPKFLYLIVVTSILMGIIYSVQTQDVGSDDVEMNLLIESMMHSPDGIIYQDIYTGKSYSTKVDFDKFQKIDLNDFFQTENKRYIMHLELTSEQMNEDYSKYYVSGEESTKENFITRTVVKEFAERMNPLGKIEKDVIVMNHKDSPFEAKLTFDAYIEK